MSTFDPKDHKIKAYCVTGPLDGQTQELKYGQYTVEAAKEIRDGNGSLTQIPIVKYYLQQVSIRLGMFTYTVPILAPRETYHEDIFSLLFKEEVWTILTQLTQLSQREKD